MSNQIGQKPFGGSGFTPQTPPEKQPSDTAALKSDLPLKDAYQPAHPKLSLNQASAPILSGAYRTLVPDCPIALFDPTDPRNDPKYLRLLGAMLFGEVEDCFEEILRELEREERQSAQERDSERGESQKEDSQHEQDKADERDKQDKGKSKK